MNSPFHEDRGDNFEMLLKKLAALSHPQKELAIEYLTKLLKDNKARAIRKIPREASTVSTLEQLVTRYPNVDFAGFISRENDAEHYQLWKLIDAFEEAAKQLGRKNFEKMHITLIVFGNKITYVSDGSIAINYERFSKEDLVKQLLVMAQQQGQ